MKKFKITLLDGTSKVVEGFKVYSSKGYYIIADEYDGICGQFIKKAVSCIVKMKEK